MVLGTVATSSARVQVIEGQIPETNPGWFVELSRRAGKSCGAEVDFAFMPWARALDMVRRGNIAAAFNSSYKLERAKFGVYPLLSGKPDPNRASKKYGYHLYVGNDLAEDARINALDLTGRTIVVERKASIIGNLEYRGAKVIEVASYISMLRVVASKRVDGAAGIDHNLDPILRRNLNLKALISKIDKPLKQSIGYVMFSKQYYAKHKDLVECFWNESAALRKTDWFRSMRAKYD